MKALNDLAGSDRVARFLGVVFDFYDNHGRNAPLLVFEFVEVQERLDLH